MVGYTRQVEHDEWVCKHNTHITCVCDTCNSEYEEAIKDCDHDIKEDVHNSECGRVSWYCTKCPYNGGGGMW